MAYLRKAGFGAALSFLFGCSLLVASSIVPGSAGAWRLALGIGSVALVLLGAGIAIREVLVARRSGRTDGFAAAVGSLPGAVIAVDRHGGILAESAEAGELLAPLFAGQEERRLPKDVVKRLSGPRGAERSFELDVAGTPFQVDLRPAGEPAGEGAFILAFRPLARDRALAAEASFSEAIRRNRIAAEIDPEGTIIRASDALARLFGSSPDDVVGQPWSAFFADAPAAESWTAGGHGEPSETHHRVSRDGDDVWLAISCDAIRDSDGNVTRLAVFGRDITEEKALADEASLRAAGFDGSATPVTLLGADGLIVEANRAARRFFGDLKDDLGEAWSGFDATDPVGETVPLGHEFLAPGGAQVLPIGQRSICIETSPLAGKARAEFAVTWRDVTDSDAAQRLAAAALRHLPLLILSPEGSVRSASGSFARIVGASAGDLQGKTMSDLGADAAAIEAALEEARGGNARTLSLHLRGRAERTAHLEAQIIPVRSRDGDVIEIVLAATDVTAMAEDNERTRSTLASVKAAGAFMHFDKWGRLIAINAAALDLLGGDEGAFLGRSREALFAQAPVAGWDAPSAGRLDLVLQDNQTITVDATICPLTAEGGMSGEVVVLFRACDDGAADGVQFSVRGSSIDPALGRIEFDTHGTVLGVNEQASAMLGRPAGSMMGQPCADVLRGEGVDEALLASLRSGRIEHRRISPETDDGAEALVTFLPFTDEKGQPAGVVALLSAAGEGEADRSLTALGAVEQSPRAFMLVGPDHTVTALNGAARDFVQRNGDILREVWPGLDPDHMVGAPIDALFPAGSPHRDAMTDLSALPHRVDLPVGEQFLSITVCGILSASGELAGWCLEWRDITARTTTEGLMRALDRSKALIEFTPEGYILNANENFCNTVGYRRDELVGQHHALVMDPGEAATEAYRQFWEQLASGETQDGVYRRRASTGEEIVLRASYTPLKDGDGNVFKVIKIADDITEEDRERQSLEVERATAEEARSLQETEQKRVVEHVGEALRRLAEGNLQYELTETFPPQYEKLRSDFNVAVSRLRAIMVDLYTTARSVKAGSSDISQAADDLSKRTEAQAATLEETAAALDQITSTVRQTAAGADEANRVAQTMRGEAQSSGEVVQNAVKAMGQIERSSKEISQIVGVIDDIAFQTNLLALNAGVEAARAGDAGRGFAVVAQEVRGLAQRCSDSAKEIKDLITASGELVGQGVDLVGSAGVALSGIAKSVESVTALIAEIAASAKEQSTSLEEVNQAMNRLDQVTQQNAAMVEETTAAGHSLAASSSALIERVGHFDLGHIDEDEAGLQDRRTFSGVPTENGREPEVRQQIAQAARFLATTGNTALVVDDEDDDWKEF